MMDYKQEVFYRPPLAAIGYLFPSPLAWISSRFFVGKSTAAVTIGQPTISRKVKKELAFSTGCASKYNQIFAKQVSFPGGYVTLY